MAPSNADATNDTLVVAACRTGRGLSDKEIQGFNVPAPLKFDLAQRQCPLVFSWQKLPAADDDCESARG